MGNYKKSSQTLSTGLWVGIALLLGIYLFSIFFQNMGDKQVQKESLHNTYKLEEVIGLIYTDYVDTLSYDSITEKVIIQILEQLDPHSAYIPASDFQIENENLQGNFEGIGIQFRIENDTLYVITPVAGGPSQKVGIMAGDRIITINDSVVAGKNISDKEIIKQLKGSKGSKVQVGIKRQGFSKLLSFTITRDVIPTYSLDYRGMLNRETGYIKISKFSLTTFEEYKKAFAELKKEGLSSLILDLRGNGGGFLDQAVSLADEFLSNNDLIVYTQGKNRKLSKKYASNKGDFETGKLVVLIDEFSASASEIVAGAIQDNDRGTIVGRRSFGKGLVQEQFNLTDGAAIRLTVARYYTPSGRCIQRPYEKGNDEYYLDYIYSIQSGEVETPDSTHSADSVEYRTKNGRIVYGGGGITPDIFIAHEKDSLLPYYNSLIRKGLIYKYCFDYADKNRNSLLEKYSKTQFISGFRISDTLFDDFLEYAQNHDVKKNAASIKKYEKEIRTLMKSYIAQHVYDDEAFYAIYVTIDHDLQKALTIINDNTQHNDVF